MGHSNWTLAKHLEHDYLERDEMIVRVGREFHIQRMDTAAIAKRNFIPEALVCRYLEVYRARKREEDKRRETASMVETE